MKRFLIFSVILCLLIMVHVSFADSSFEEGFRKPPSEVKPGVLWDWMHDMITREGITYDLEALKNNGYGHLTIMHVGEVDSTFNPQHNMPECYLFNTPEWFDVFGYALDECYRLGLKILSFNSSGWCHSGGPWIKPEQAVQHFGWTEADVQGPQSGLSVRLMTNQSDLSIGYLAVSTPNEEIKWVQVDLGQETTIDEIILYPLVYAGIKGYGFPLRYRIEVSNESDFSEPIIFADYTKNDVANTGMVPVVINGRKLQGRYVRLFATKLKFNENDGQHSFGLNELEVISNGNNVALGAAVTARDSVEQSGCSRKGLTDGLKYVPETSGDSAGASVVQLKEVSEYTADIAVLAWPISSASSVPIAKVIELTSKIHDGQLVWDVPEGKWKIRRYMMYNARAYTRVPPKGGVGLECDKLDKDAVKAQFDGMIGKFIQERPSLAGKTFVGIEADSWEVGHPGWSPKFRQEFKTRRGYDPVPWILHLKDGPIIENQEISKRFAYDYKLTLIDLFADNFFSYMSELCHEHGMKLYAEAYRGPFDPITCGGRADMPMGEFWVSTASMNTCRWAASSAHTYGHPYVSAESFTARWNDGAFRADPYMLKRVGDLAFCNGVNNIIIHGMPHQPWGGKVKPGMTMGKWGTVLGPNQTWWKPSRAWTSYLSRCQYLLQQGDFQADILQLIPLTEWYRQVSEGLHKLYNYDICSEEILIDQLDFVDGRYVLPSGMEYRVLVLPKTNGVMKPELLKKIESLVKKGGTIVVQDRPDTSPSLENYPQCDTQVTKLTNQVWGDLNGQDKTEHHYGQGKVVWANPGSEYQDIEATSIYDKRKREGVIQPFWGDAAMTITWSDELKKLLRDMNVLPDVEIRSFNKIPVQGQAQEWTGRSETNCGVREGENVFAWIHRRTDDADIYFVASQVADPVTAELVFRVQGKQPEWWNPDTGEIMNLLAWDESDRRTKIPLSFEPYESKFIVFQKPTKGRHIKALSCDGRRLPSPASLDLGKKGFLVDAEGQYEITYSDNQVVRTSVKQIPNTIDVEGQWDVLFPVYEEKIKTVQLPLGLWNESDDEYIRYFSGTAIYRKDISIPKELVEPGLHLALDLGVVKNLAEVFINGKEAAILWKEPFYVDITDLVKSGQNKLEIHISNTWANRLIGDEQYPADLEWHELRDSYGHQGDTLAHIPDWVWNGNERSQPQRKTFTTWRHRDTKSDSPLEPSGLLGPVKVKTLRLITLEIN